MPGSEKDFTITIIGEVSSSWNGDEYCLTGVHGPQLSVSTICVACLYALLL